MDAQPNWYVYVLPSIFKRKQSSEYHWLFGCDLDESDRSHFEHSVVPISDLTTYGISTLANIFIQ